MDPTCRVLSESLQAPGPAEKMKASRIMPGQMMLNEFFQRGGRTVVTAVRVMPVIIVRVAPSSWWGECP